MTGHLNCGHTEHNEYDERWFNTRPREGLSTYDPPGPAWEIPEIYAKHGSRLMAATALQFAARMGGKHFEHRRSYRSTVAQTVPNTEGVR